MITAGGLFLNWREAPFCDLIAITGGTPALVLAPHPDDESIGFGGLIAAATARGDAIEVAFLTDGTGSHPGSLAYPAPRLRRLREAEALRALALLGVGADHVTFLAAPDTNAPQRGAAFDELVARLARLIRERRIETILTTWYHDPHCDHEAAALLAAAVARLTGVRIFNAPVWGWTLPPDQVLPGPAPAALRLDVGAWLPAKRRAIAAHVSQLTDLITDSPGAFRLQPEFLSLFDQPWEVFLRP